jgi:pimeloyl-ACP methyl ester carboxylesterase
VLLAIDHGHHAIAFDRYGDEASPVMVLLHGLSGARTTYSAVVRHLLDGPVGAGRLQLVNADLRGHGESSHVERAGYHAAAYADDVAALIEHVDAGPALVVGHSLGGVVACSLAARRPALVARLLLEDPPIFEGDDARRAASPVAAFFPMFVAAVRDLQQRGAPLEAYEELIAPAATDPSGVPARARSLMGWDPATMEAAVDGTVWSTFDPMAPLACPVTLLRADPALGAVFVAGDEPLWCDANPQTHVVMIEGAAHGIHDTATLPSYLQHLDAAVTAFVKTPRR